MFGTDNTIKVLVGKDITWTGSGASLDPYSANYIKDGEIRILDVNDAVCDAAPSGADTSYFKFAQRSGDAVHFSPRIKKSDVVKITTKVAKSAVEQVTYVGYNGTSGTIEAINNNEYIFQINFKQDKTMWSEQQNRKVFHYVSGDSATAKDVAESITRQINLDTWVHEGVKAEIITTLGTEGALGGVPVTISANNGSDTIVASGFSSGIAVGDVIRIAGTGATNPVYIVKEILSTTTYRIHCPYQGASATSLVSKIVTANTSYGIKLTGLALTYKAKGLKPYNKVFFDVYTTGWGTTTVTYATAMSWGSGTYEQVADLEWFALGGDGIRNFMWHPIPEGRTDATVGKTYLTYTIEYKTTAPTEVVSGNHPSRGLVYIFTETESTGTQSTRLTADIPTVTGLTF